LTEELLNAFEFETTQLILVPSDGGKFEVTVDGDLLYSKTRAGRHAEPGEVVEAVRQRLQRQS
jgi:selenoprotein W-related protein